MSIPRTAAPLVRKTLGILSVTLLACGLTVPQAALAEFQASSGLTEALGSLNAGKTPENVTSNISVLKEKLNSLTARINAGGNAGERIQLQAAAKALQAIIERLEAGFALTNYSVTTDAATLETTATLHFSNADTGQTSTFTAVIPSAEGDSANAAPEDVTQTGNDTGGASDSDAPDLLTQILQQLGSQMVGGQNPLGNIQGTLNGLMSGTANPLQALSGAIEQAATSALQCTANGTKATGGNGTAVYDIAAGKVYMPNGEVLEAHSGLGAMMDNPNYVNQRMRGSTPPNVYSLSMRETPFHGTQAIRLTPGDPGSMYGRDGILAHPPLRRGSIGSSGCIAFADYSKFLAAFQRGEVRQIVVVPSASEANKKCTAPVYNTPSPGASAGTPTR